MGADERVPLSRADVDASDPQSRALADHLSQPPIGCQYIDTSTNFVTLPDNVHTTLDFRTTAGNVTYDPYNLIDTTNDRVKVPQPGIWDCHAEVLGTFSSSNSPAFSQITQGLVNVDEHKPMCGLNWLSGATNEWYHTLGQFPLYVTRAWMATNTYLYVRAINVDIAGAADGTAKIVSFTMWLRSAVIPGRY